MASRAWAINVGGVDSVGAATITAPDLLTIVGHTLATGDLIAVDTLTGGGIGPLEESVVYFVRDVVGDDFKLSGSRGGPLIQFGSAGTVEVYVSVPGYSAEELRQISSHGMFHGSVNRLGARQGIRPGAGDPVTVAGTQWTVQTHTGTVEPADTSAQGPYVYVQLSTAGALDPADGTNSRIDALDLQILDDDADASGFRRSQVVYVPGTPAGTPSAPTVTARSLRLATILVSAGGSPDPTVQSLAQFTVASGGILPARTASELPTVGLVEGTYADQADIGQLLRWNGTAWAPLANPNGVQFWQTVTFTSGGTFTKANFSGLRKVRVRCQAGGGAGGGSEATDGTQASSSGGGAAGHYAESYLDVSALSTNVTVTVGTGGAPATGVQGGTGGSSSFGSLVVAPGGPGGFPRGESTLTRASSGGIPASGGTGDLVIPGSGGSGGLSWANDGSVDFGQGGVGGGSHMGGSTYSNRSGADVQINGQLYGGGGGGRSSGPSELAKPGGTGGSGIVIIDLYV